MGGDKTLLKTCRIDLDGALGTLRDFFLVCPDALAASTGCQVLSDRCFRPHFAVSARFGLGAWSNVVQVVRATSPLASACWLEYPDRCRYLLLSLYRRFGEFIWICCYLFPWMSGSNYIGLVGSLM